MNESDVKFRFRMFPTEVEEIIREHCQKTGVEFRYGDIKGFKSIDISPEHFLQSSPITTGIISPLEDLSPRKIGRAFFVFREDDPTGPVIGGERFPSREVKLFEGMRLSDVALSEGEKISFWAIVTIWTEIRISFSYSILEVTHWVEILSRHDEHGIEGWSLK